MKALDAVTTSMNMEFYSGIHEEGTTLAANQRTRVGIQTRVDLIDIIMVDKKDIFLYILVHTYIIPYQHTLYLTHLLNFVKRS
jgi:hypothetical protein